MPLYTTTTLGAATAALASRLEDPGLRRWTQPELAMYVREALRTWQAWTAGYRDRGTFALASQEAFYDLPTALPSLRGYTVGVQELIGVLQYHLLEPYSPAAWAGTDQFSLEDLRAAIQSRRDQFLRETGAVLTRLALTISPTPVGREALPDTVALVRRLAWRSTSGAVTALMREDSWGADHYHVAWPQQSRRPPLAYSVSATPPLLVQILPPPLDTGALDLHVIQDGAPLVVADNTPLGIPDDWAWVVKWGALADLLSRDGLALDTARAAYAEQRWAHGVSLARTAPVVIGGAINERVVPLGSVADADKYTPGWQSVPGTPRRLLSAAQNVLAACPPPGVARGGGTWSATLDVVCNMPVPAVDNPAAPLQISETVIDAVLDYAQHLAIFKEGSAQLDAARALLDRFASACGVTVRLQQASQPARRPLLAQTVQDTQSLPEQLDPAGAV